MVFVPKTLLKGLFAIKETINFFKDNNFWVVVDRKSFFGIIVIETEQGFADWGKTGTGSKLGYFFKVPGAIEK